MKRRNKYFFQRIVFSAFVCLLFSCNNKPDATMRKGDATDWDTVFSLQANIVSDTDKFKIIFVLKNKLNTNVFVKESCERCFTYKYWVLRSELYEGGPGGGTNVVFGEKERYIYLRGHAEKSFDQSSIKFSTELPKINGKFKQVKFRFENKLQYYIVGDSQVREISIEKDFFFESSAFE